MYVSEAPEVALFALAPDLDFHKVLFSFILSARARARARVDRASAATRAAGAARPLTPVVKGEAGGCRRRAHFILCVFLPLRWRKRVG